MEKAMIDTSVLIDLIKKKKLSKFIESKEVYISIITLWEYLRGIYYKKPEFFEEEKVILEELFKIIPIDNNVIRISTKIWAELKKTGKMIEDADIIIGASAISRNLPLITLNKRHYERLRKFGLKIK